MVSPRPTYMLDTNICIYLMKRQPPQVAHRFAQCRVGDVVISAITAAELEFGVVVSGADKEHNRKALDRLIQEVPVAPFDAVCARAYGPVRLTTRERRRDALDKLIAAHAMALNVTLVTNNPDDFGAFSALKIENWIG